MTSRIALSSKFPIWNPQRPRSTPFLTLHSWHTSNKDINMKLSGYHPMDQRSKTSRMTLSSKSLIRNPKFPLRNPNLDPQFFIKMSWIIIKYSLTCVKFCLSKTLVLYVYTWRTFKFPDHVLSGFCLPWWYNHCKILFGGHGHCWCLGWSSLQLRNIPWITLG